LFRKELSSRSADFLADVQDSLNRSPGTRVSKRRARELARVSITVFYHESLNKNAEHRVASKRRNFRREI
jgi:hypothetical protein